MSKPLRLLIVEDSEDDAALLLRALRIEGYEVVYEIVDTADAMRAALESGEWDVITSDHAMPRFSAPESLALAKALRPHVPFIILSGEIDLNLAVSLMKDGAQDYIQKRELKRIGPAIERELKEAESIIQRRWAEEALAQSHAELSAIYDHAPVMMCLLDPDRRVLYANRALRAFTGFSEEETRGGRACGVFGCIKAQDAPGGCGYGPDCGDCRILAAIEDTIKTGAAHRDVEHYTKMEHNGMRRDVVLLGSTVRIPTQDEGNVLLCMLDITARVRAAESLRESEERYKVLTEKSFAGIYVVQDGRFVFLNENAASFAGYKPEELIGRESDSIVHPEDRDGIRDRAASMLHSHDPSPHEFRIVTKDGQVRWIIERISAIHYKGNPAILGNSMDTTAYKKADSDRQSALEALRAVHELEKGILQSVPHALFGVERRLIFFANEAMEAVFGWKPEEVIGKSTRLIFRTDEEWLQYGGILYARLEKEPVVVFEWDIPFVRKDGSEFFCRMSVSRIGAELGESRRIVATFEDISDRRRAEEEKRDLERRLALSQKLESIGTLAGGIAHDFNNLLMGIQGNASLMLMDLDPSHPHYVRLKHVEEHVASGADLTKQLLGFSRGGRYDVRPLSMNDLVRKSTEMFGRTKKEIAIHRTFAADPCMVEADRSQMEQVFMNLLVNAWHAMPGGGDIFITTERIFLDDAGAAGGDVKPGFYIKVNVTDTGTGMDEQTKERIFDPFFTTKGMGRGAGLGLATAYGIIKGHGGMINVYSEPGHGTTFTLYVPASDKNPVEEKTAPPATLRGNETILLVDDEPMVLDVSREMLASLGYRVHTAGNGQEAVALYLEHRDEVDLVILDMVMPGISGSGTFDRLREINPGVKVLLASGYSINGQAQGIMDRGCNGFIQKPFQMGKLSRRVREILD